MKIAHIKELVNRRIARFKDETDCIPNALLASTDVFDLLVESGYEVTFMGLAVYEVPATNPRTAIVAYAANEQS